MNHRQTRVVILQEGPYQVASLKPTSVSSKLTSLHGQLGVGNILCSSQKKKHSLPATLLRVLLYGAALLLYFPWVHSQEYERMSSKLPGTQNSSGNRRKWAEVIHLAIHLGIYFLLNPPFSMPWKNCINSHSGSLVFYLLKLYWIADLQNCTVISV